MTLTDKGEGKAVELSEKHEVLKEFFIILGLDEELADEDACKIEHVVRRETMEKLTEFVDLIQSNEKSISLDRFREDYETGDLDDTAKTPRDRRDRED